MDRMYRGCFVRIGLWLTLGIGSLTVPYFDGGQRSRELVALERTDRAERRVEVTREWFRDPVYDITLVVPTSAPAELEGLAKEVPLMRHTSSSDPNELPFPPYLREDPSYKKIK